MMDYGYAGWTRDENFLKVRMNFCSDELEESVLLLVFVIQRQNERYFCVVFGLATFTDCTPGGLIPEILITNYKLQINEIYQKKSNMSRIWRAVRALCLS